MQKYAVPWLLTSALFVPSVNCEVNQCYIFCPQQCHLVPNFFQAPDLWRLGSGPVGQSPVKWGEILYVRMSVCPYIHLQGQTSQASGPSSCASELASQAWAPDLYQ